MICTKVTKSRKDATDLYHLLHPFSLIPHPEHVRTLFYGLKVQSMKRSGMDFDISIIIIKNRAVSK